MFGRMKTLLTLDADVAVRLRRMRQTSGHRFETGVNEALRRGLRRMSDPDDRPIRCRTPPVDLGRSRIGSLDGVAEALVVAEGERFR